MFNMRALLLALLLNVAVIAAPSSLDVRQLPTCPVINCQQSFIVHQGQAIHYEDSVVDMQFMSFDLIQTPQDTIAISVSSRVQVGFRVLLSVDAFGFQRSIDVPPGQSFSFVLAEQQFSAWVEQEVNVQVIYQKNLPALANMLGSSGGPFKRQAGLPCPGGVCAADCHQCGVFQAYPFK